MKVIGQEPREELTFVFTDIQDSTRLWEVAPRSMAAALERHGEIVEEAITRNGGEFVRSRGEGDSTFSVFRDPLSALRAVCDLQLAIHREEWPDDAVVRVRAALRTGVGFLMHGDYNSSDVNRCARLRGLAAGGQTLVCQVTAERVPDPSPAGLSLECLGSHRLKDLLRAERIYQLRHPDLPSEFPPLRSLDTLPTNLPAQLTSFIGRRRELDEVHDRLRKNRLVTLTGAGGSGKTRLALQAAADMLDDHTDGVWLAALAPIAEARLVAPTVASAMGIAESPVLPVEEQLERELRSSNALLVLDNCEHLLSACAELVERLLMACPQLGVLATSRAALGITGETVYPVPSLDVPSLEDSTADAVLSSSAGRLFVERTAAVRGSYEVTHERAATIGGICRRLDGIPLAIELASAKVRVMTVQDIALRLDDCLGLLTGGRPSALQRHETLGALIDWSHNLLSDAEQRLMRRMAVFAGGCDLSAVETVCTGQGIEQGKVIELLDTLVHQSLVIHEDHEERSRYRMLETVRQYGRRKLRDHDELDASVRRHRDYYCRFVCDNAGQLVGPEQSVWLRRFDEEHDNIRAALACFRDRADDIEEGLRLAASLWRFWQARGYFGEGHSWVVEMLQRPGAEARTSGRAAALTTLGIMHHSRSAFREAVPVLTESLSIREELGDRVGTARTLNALGVIANEEGRNADAEGFYARSVALHREAGNRHGEGLVLGNLGNVRLTQDQYAAALIHYDQALAIFRELNNDAMAGMALHNLSTAHSELGHGDEALACIREALQKRSDLGDVVGTASSKVDLARLRLVGGHVEEAEVLLLEALKTQSGLGSPRELTNTLDVLSAVALAQGRSERAGRLLGASTSIRERIVYPRVGPFAKRGRALLSQLVEALGQEACDAAMDRGRAMTDEQAVAYALETEPPR